MEKRWSKISRTCVIFRNLWNHTKRTDLTWRMTAKAKTESEIVRFYENSTILISGGTGFLGRILVSKLLRSCEVIRRIYLIIRVKKNKDPSVRFQEFLKDSVFLGIPNIENKVICVAGDCSLPDLGLNENDRTRLAKEITHVFHAAASVNFDEKLTTAIAVNVLGVKEMLNLCRDCDKLKSVVYVSSTFAYCVRDTVGERIYDIPLRAKDAVYLMQNLNAEKLESMKDGIIAPWPNTYNFSKALAEDVIKEEQGLPIGIFRPSIVIGTSEEPVPGWINNLYGPAGVVAGVGAGMLRVLKVNTSLRADLVPVDMTVNALICSAWDIHNIYLESETAKNNPADKNPTSSTILRCDSRIPIYNFVTSDSNSVTWKDYLYYSMLHGKKIPPLNSLWYITLTTTKLDIIYKTLMVLYHILPAVVLDTSLALAGRKTRMLRTYKKIHKFSKVISYFTMKEWVFERNNVEKLWHALNETDKKLFNFDMGKINWNSYFRNTMSGLRIYLFKDEESTIPMARRKMLFLFLCHRLLQLIAVTLTLWLTFHVYKGLMR